jgi:competence protein ComEC
LALLFGVRQKITFIFQNALPQHHASLLLGIVFGIKGDFPTSYYENLKQAGVLHVIAASGMNVAMVASFLSAIFGKFLKRQYGLALTIVGIFVYALFSGLEPSIVRASIMGTLVFLSQMLGRQRLSWYLLLLTACGMLFFYPYLLQDAGFQLSFMATAGILGFSQILKRYIAGFMPSFVSEDVITTIGAQLTTVPLLLLHFGSYSLASIAANALVLWEIPFLMIIGGAGAIIGFLSRPLGTFILYLSVPLLTYFDIVINSFSNYAGQIVFTEIPVVILIGYYFILAAIWMILVKNHSKSGV